MKNQLIYFLFCFSFIFCIEKIEETSSFYRCGENFFNITPRFINKALHNDDNFDYIKSFTQDNDIFKDFNIYLDLLNFEYEIKQYNLEDKREFFINGMNRAIETIKSLLKVKKTKKDFFISDEYIKNITEINIWDKTKIGDEMERQNKTFESLGIDLYIFVRFVNSSVLSKEVLAAAGPFYIDDETNQPYLGLLLINSDVEYSKPNSLRYFESIVLHEFTHVLGFTKNLFKLISPPIYFFKNDKDGINRAYLNSTKVLNVAKKYFNCDEIDGIPLEEIGGNGTFGSHWEERVLLGEYMCGAIYREEQSISEFTLALLEDLGYYKANYYTGGLMQYGKNKGCDFLNSKCVNNGKVNPKFKNEFFDNIRNNNIDPGCSSGRQSRVYHHLVNFESIPNNYQYFNSSEQGGRPTADYCPVFMEDIKEGNNLYYIGHCSDIGSGEYGILIPNNYSNDNISNISYFKNGDLVSITGEANSNNSFCALSSLIDNKNESYKYLSNTIRAVCYKMYCSDKSLTIQINNDFIVCPRSGGKIKALNYDGYLICPDYNLICSGTVMCNNMFDCVAKKSLLKEVKYDYESKTTQDLIEIENDIISEDSYELSNNGKCPIYCTQCNELNQCINCRKNYDLYEIKQKIKCIFKIENCKNYNDNGNKCVECNEGYKINEKENKCEKDNNEYLYLIIIFVSSGILLIIIIILVIITIKLNCKMKDLKEQVYKISFIQDNKNDDDKNELK